MSEWWMELSPINRGFYVAAVFFGVLFSWQLIAALMGLAEDGGGDVDADVDVDVGGDDATVAHVAEDASDTMMAFKLLSVRSVLTFCTLFTWGTALYLGRGDSLSRAMGVATVWGLAGMGCVGLLLAWLPKLAQSGNKDIRSSLGTTGTVYLDIPAGGCGEVRIMVSGLISYVTATCSTGEALKAGVPILVEQAIDPTQVVVRPVSTGQEEEEEGEG
jgi:hypothetical protein